MIPLLHLSQRSKTSTHTRLNHMYGAKFAADAFTPHQLRYSFHGHFSDSTIEPSVTRAESSGQAANCSLPEEYFAATIFYAALVASSIEIPSGGSNLAPSSLSLLCASA
jgi:hypothetical protein